MAESITDAVGGGDTGVGDLCIGLRSLETRLTYAEAGFQCTPYVVLTDETGVTGWFPLSRE